MAIPNELLIFLAIKNTWTENPKITKQLSNGQIALVQEICQLNARLVTPDAAPEELAPHIKYRLTEIAKKHGFKDGIIQEMLPRELKKYKIKDKEPTKSESDEQEWEAIIPSPFGQFKTARKVCETLKFLNGHTYCNSKALDYTSSSKSGRNVFHTLAEFGHHILAEIVREAHTKKIGKNPTTESLSKLISAPKCDREKEEHPRTLTPLMIATRANNISMFRWLLYNRATYDIKILFPEISKEGKFHFLLLWFNHEIKHQSTPLMRVKKRFAKLKKPHLEERPLDKSFTKIGSKQQQIVSTLSGMPLDDIQYLFSVYSKRNPQGISQMAAKIIKAEIKKESDKTNHELITELLNYCQKNELLAMLTTEKREHTQTKNKNLILSKKVTQLKEEKREAKFKLVGLKRELETLQEESNENTQSLAEANEILYSSPNIKLVKELQQHIKRLQTILAAEKEEEQQHIKRLQARLSDEKYSHTQTKNKNLRLIAEVADLRETSPTSSPPIRTFSSPKELEQADNECIANILREQKAEANAIKFPLLEKENARLQKQTITLQKKLATTIEKLKVKEQEVKKANTELNDTINDIMQQSQPKDRMITKLLQENMQLKQEVEKTKPLSVDSLQTVEKSLPEIKQLKEENTQLQQKLDKAEKDYETANFARAGINRSITEKLENKVKLLEEQYKVANNGKTISEEQLKASKVKLDQVEQTLSKQTAELAKLKSKDDNQQSSFSKLHKRLAPTDTQDKAKKQPQPTAQPKTTSEKPKPRKSRRVYYFPAPKLSIGRSSPFYKKALQAQAARKRTSEQTKTTTNGKLST